MEILFCLFGHRYSVFKWGFAKRGGRLWSLDEQRGFKTGPLGVGSVCGGGGGGFLWSGTESAQFGIGYGGMVGEYIIADWLLARMMIGGGGYAVSKIISETDTTLQVKKISSGGFILFHPQIVADIKIGQWASLGFSIGYFLPNIARLHSPSFSIQLMFGRI